MVESQTESQYKKIIGRCRSVFMVKNQDYGTSWRILRLPSITDQIFIKASRLRSIQEKQVQKVADRPEDEFMGIINYCIMALIQLELAGEKRTDMPVEEVMSLYDRFAGESFELMQQKNHDYGEAWRLMRVSSITDIILMRLLRVKQIEENGGQTVASEGVAANYQDMLNYSVFALILLEEQGS